LSEETEKKQPQETALKDGNFLDGCRSLLQDPDRRTSERAIDLVGSLAKNTTVPKHRAAIDNPHPPNKLRPEKPEIPVISGTRY
jgi:hypothetical protein